MVEDEEGQVAVEGLDGVVEHRVLGEEVGRGGGGGEVFGEDFSFALVDKGGRRGEGLHAEGIF